MKQKVELQQIRNILKARPQVGTKADSNKDSVGLALTLRGMSHYKR